MVTIAESGLVFGPYRDEHCFHVEKSATYQRVRDRVHMAEFLLLRPKEKRTHQIWVEAAKASSPRSGNPIRFDQFIDEIGQKLTNGLTLGVSARLKRHKAAETELSADFKSFDLATVEFRLVLVIKGHKPDWLPELQNALTAKLHALVRTWALGGMSIAVLNEEGARRHGLIR